MNAVETATPHPSHQISTSSRQLVDAPSLRLYQVWKGNNVFLLGGRFIFGPDAKSLYLTVFLILAPVLLFCSFVSQRLVTHFSHSIGRLFVAIPAVLTLYILVLILLVSGRDPGIVPRNTHPPEPDDECDASSISTDWAGSQSGAPYIPPTKSVTVNGMIVRVKYCQTCMLYRPPRCSHCSICNNCVERFDHHCPWVGQCIGKRNYRYFFMFVSSTTFLCFYVFAFSWINIKKIMENDHCGVWRALTVSPVSGILIVYTFTVSWFVGGLSSFHLYLVMTNQTTYENFRYRYDRRMNPYNRGCARNFKDILLSRIPKSKHDFRSTVTPESPSIFSSTRYLNRVVSTDMAKMMSLDREIGKRQVVDTTAFEDIQDPNGSGVAGGLERCGTQLRHSNWEPTPELRKSASEHRAEHDTSEGDKIRGEVSKEV